jgi:hypothetical protein
MRQAESRLQALEERLLPPPPIDPIFIKVCDSSIAEPGQPDPLRVTDADLTGYASGALVVHRLPGERLDKLEARCRQVAPTSIIWLARYAGRGI